MKNQPFIVPLSGLMSGIISAGFMPSISSSVGILFLCFSYLILVLSFRFRKIFIFSLFLVFLSVGFVSANSKNREYPLHPHFLNGNHLIKLKIDDTYKPSEKFKKFKAEIVSVDTVSVSENYALLYWKKQNPDLFPGDEIRVYSNLNLTQKTLNPYQFDYAKYLKRQGIGYVIFTDSVYYKEKTGKSFFHQTAEFKREIYQKLITHGYSKQSADIIGAMLLGDRNEMDKDVEEQYRKTGVVHILSISGLHVMMVYGIFLLVFYPLIFLPKGKFVRIFASLILIWAYSFFVGLQPPVVRSALMISVFHLTLAFHRKPNIYHTLAVSAFILLLVNPGWLFDVGFQLSFSAVFFIVWLMPAFTKLFHPKSKSAKIVTGFVGTSISAQLGTFPISVYYFHQTSGLFLAGNVVMIMASNFMIAGGMLSVALAMFNLFPEKWVWVFNSFIKLCNDYIQWLSGFDSLIFEGISFNLSEVFLILMLIILLRFVLLKPKFRYLVLSLSILLVFEVQRIFIDKKLVHKKEVIIFHQNRNSIIGIRNGNGMDVFMMNPDDSVKVKNYILKPYTIHEKIKRMNLFAMKDPVHSYYYKSNGILWWENQKIGIAGKGFHGKIPKVDYLLIQNNAKINPASVPESVKIIVDGSNYPGYLKDSQRNAWITRESGAFIIGSPSIPR